MLQHDVGGCRVEAVRLAGTAQGFKAWVWFVHGGRLWFGVAFQAGLWWSGGMLWEDAATIFREAALAMGAAEATPLHLVRPHPEFEGMEALEVLDDAVAEARQAWQQWIDTGRWPPVKGPAATMLRLRLEFAWNLGQCLEDAQLAVPEGWRLPQAMRFLGEECAARAMLPAVDRMWLEFHGRQAE